MTTRLPSGGPTDPPSELPPDLVDGNGGELEHDADLDSLANERTLLAWVRTGFALVAAGGLVLHQSEYALRSPQLVAGLGMVAMGIGIWATGYVRFRTGERAIALDDPTLPLTSVRLVALAASVSAACALVLAMVGN